MINNQYEQLLQTILLDGELTKNRTNIDTLTIPGAMLTYNLATEGFPAITTKRLAFNQVKGELIGFLRGYTSAAQFRELGCKIWDQNANENQSWLKNIHRKGTDDLGKIYGFQWRHFNGVLDEDSKNPDVPFPRIGFDQLEAALKTLRCDPTSRRNIVSAWNPLQLHQMALPPCHVMFQLIANPSTSAANGGPTLHMCMYQRSCDMFLGVPFNIASYALLLSLFCQWAGYKPGKLTMFLADAHIYVNHLDQVKEQLSRTPFPFPTLSLTDDPNAQLKGIKHLTNGLKPDHIALTDYLYHPAIAAPMAV